MHLLAVVLGAFLKLLFVGVQAAGGKRASTAAGFVVLGLIVVGLVIYASSATRQIQDTADQTAALHVQFGNTERAAENYELALVRYGEALEISRDYADAYSQRGLTYALMGDFERALEDSTQSIDLSRGVERAPAYFTRARVYTLMKQYDSALADYQHALEANSSFDPAYRETGSIYYSLEQYDQALNWYERYLQAVSSESLVESDIMARIEELRERSE